MLLLGTWSTPDPAGKEIGALHKKIDELFAEMFPEAVPHMPSSCRPVAFEKLLRALENLLVHDGRMLADVNLAPVGDPADVENIGEQAIETMPVEGPSARHVALPGGPPLVGPAPRILHEHHEQAQGHDDPLGILVVGVPILLDRFVDPGPRPETAPVSFAEAGQSSHFWPWDGSRAAT